jgi:hypothetical protein
MGMFDSFLGQNTGYTKAQSTGLKRSAEIKKRRKEDERAFTKSQEEAKGRRALEERRIIETGETRRAGMRVAGGIEEQKIAGVGQMARQELIGEQAVEAATTAATRKAATLSVKRGHELSLAEIKAGGKDLKLFTAFSGEPGVFDPRTGEAQRLTLPSTGATLGERARAGLGQEAVSKSILTDFLDMSDSEKRSHMKRLQKEDPDAYLSLAKQYKMLRSPDKKTPEYESGTGVGGRSIL